MTVHCNILDFSCSPPLSMKFGQKYSYSQTQDLSGCNLDHQLKDLKLAICSFQVSRHYDNSKVQQVLTLDLGSLFVFICLSFVNKVMFN